jgi:hypothetical protein
MLAARKPVLVWSQKPVRASPRSQREEGLGEHSVYLSSWVQTEERSGLRSTNIIPVLGLLRPGCFSTWPALSLSLFFLLTWSLNSGLHTCKEGALPLEPHLLRRWSQVVAWVGLKL